MWIFKLGPYHNPQEVYKYSDLPFCEPPPIEPQTKASGLGEILSGVEYFNSGYDIKFKENVDMKLLCSSKLSQDDVLDFNYAIANHYWYQMQVDDLPIWGFIGQIAADADIIGKERKIAFYSKVKKIELKKIPSLLFRTHDLIRGIRIPSRWSSS